MKEENIQKEEKWKKDKKEEVTNIIVVEYEERITKMN